MTENNEPAWAIGVSALFREAAVGRFRRRFRDGFRDGSSAVDELREDFRPTIAADPSLSVRSSPARRRSSSPPLLSLSDWTLLSYATSGIRVGANNPNPTYR